jgi:hypothetical protein
MTINELWAPARKSHADMRAKVSSRHSDLDLRNWVGFTGRRMFVAERPVAQRTSPAGWEMLLAAKGDLCTHLHVARALAPPIPKLSESAIRHLY